jgi:hypothetical protein
MASWMELSSRRRRLAEYQKLICRHQLVGDRARKGSSRRRRLERRKLAAYHELKCRQCLLERPVLERNPRL